MKIVYIAHPIGGNVKRNIKKVLKIVREINMSEPETLPFAPYVVDCQALDDNRQYERARGIKNNQHLLRSGIVKELWLYGSIISRGMLSEIDIAIELGIPVIAKSKEINLIFGK